MSLGRLNVGSLVLTGYFLLEGFFVSAPLFGFVALRLCPFQRRSGPTAFKATPPYIAEHGAAFEGSVFGFIPLPPSPRTLPAP